MTARPGIRCVVLVALSALTLASGAGGQETGQIPPSRLMAEQQPSPPSQNPTAPQPPGSPRAGSSSSHGSPNATPGDQRRLPDDSATKHTRTGGGRTLAFIAPAGSLRLFNEKGEPQADIAYTAYQLDG